MQAIGVLRTWSSGRRVEVGLGQPAAHSLIDVLRASQVDDVEDTLTRTLHTSGDAGDCPRLVTARRRVPPSRCFGRSSTNVRDSLKKIPTDTASTSTGPTDSRWATTARKIGSSRSGHGFPRRTSSGEHGTWSSKTTPDGWRSHFRSRPRSLRMALQAFGEGCRHRASMTSVRGDRPGDTRPPLIGGKQ